MGCQNRSSTFTSALEASSHSHEPPSCCPPACRRLAHDTDFLKTPARAHRRSNCTLPPTLGHQARQQRAVAVTPVVYRCPATRTRRRLRCRQQGDIFRGGCGGQLSHLRQSTAILSFTCDSEDAAVTVWAWPSPRGLRPTLLADISHSEVSFSHCFNCSCVHD